MFTEYRGHGGNGLMKLCQTKRLAPNSEAREVENKAPKGRSEIGSRL